MDNEELKKRLNEGMAKIIDDYYREITAGEIAPDSDMWPTESIPFDEIDAEVEGVSEPIEDEAPADKRVVRSNSSGDRVYLLDEIKKTRQWVTNPEVLKGLGFEITDVADIEDVELLKYQMAAAIYRTDENN